MTAPTRTRGQETGRDAALTAFYQAHHQRLDRHVRARARATDQVVEDACAYAWLHLVRRADVGLDRAGYQWLRTVAIHEAWRLAAPATEQPAGAMMPEIDHPNELREPTGPASDPLELVIAAELHHARRAAFKCLEARERRELLLHASGYRYQEIAALTGTSYTAVNRRLDDGRKRLRRIWGTNIATSGL
jgi:DNA-directed RNA polymerase specialized sigma24 family protein